MPEEVKKELPAIPLIKQQQERLGMLTVAIRNMEMQRDIMLKTILECHGVLEDEALKQYMLNQDGSILVPMKDLRDQHPLVQAGVQPQALTEPVKILETAFATSPTEPVTEDVERLN